MAKKTVSVEVSKETHEVGVLVAGVIKAIIQKKPIAQIAVEELEALKTAVDGVTSIPAEPKEDPKAFGLAVCLPILDVVGELLASAPEETPAS